MNIFLSHDTIESLKMNATRHVKSFNEIANYRATQKRSQRELRIANIALTNLRVFSVFHYLVLYLRTYDIPLMRITSILRSD